MAMSGYFTEGQPSPGVHSPPTLTDHDRDSLSKEPLELSSGKTYDTIKGKTDGRHISIFSHVINKLNPRLISVEREYFNQFIILLQ